MELTLTERLYEIIEPVVETNGFVLFQVKYYPMKNNGKLEIFIDNAEGGITIKECSFVARELSLVLDNEDIIPNKYNLEVASPGIDWEISDDKSLRRILGKNVRVKFETDNKQLELVGDLDRFDDEKIILIIAKLEKEVFRASIQKVEQEIKFKKN